MSRSQSYRSRVPTHIIQMLDVASRITLFLVGQNGPLAFIFKDRLQNKHKTVIGSDIKCTCSINKNDHCIHSLYVLLKIFKVSTENPIIWQAAYIDNQLQDLVSGKHTVETGMRRNIPQFQFQDYNFTFPSHLFQKKKNCKTFQHPVNQKVQQMILDSQSVCPICQQQMKKQMCLTYCKIGCGNNYHLECLKVWITHKKNQQAKLTCPMCRQQFHHTIIEDLKMQQIQFKKKQVVKKSQRYKCSSCGFDQIRQNVHKCLLCSSFQLCQPCYQNKKHIKHPFVKINQKGQWQGAAQRRTNQLKIKQFIDNKRKQSKNKQLLQKLRKVEQDPSKLLDYVASSYPYVSKYISQNIDPYKKLDINQNDMKCQKCKSKRMIFLRRLTCGHFIDHECLKQNIRKGIFFCQQDGSKILKGYQDLISKQKELEFQKQKVQYLIDNQFNPRHFQNEVYQSQRNIEYFRSQPQFSQNINNQEIISLTDILRPGNSNTRNQNFRIKEQRISNRLINKFSNNRIPEQNSIQRRRKSSRQKSDIKQFDIVNRQYSRQHSQNRIRNSLINNHTNIINRINQRRNQRLFQSNNLNLIDKKLLPPTQIKSQNKRIPSRNIEQLTNLQINNKRKKSNLQINKLNYNSTNNQNDSRFPNIISLESNHSNNTFNIRNRKQFNQQHQFLFNLNL